MRRLIWLSVVAAFAIAYPLLLSSPFQQRLGALVLLYAIAASAWNIVGEQDLAQRTPDLSPIIQEVVDRSNNRLRLQ